MHTVLQARVTRSVEEITGRNGKVFWKVGMVTQSVDKKNPDGTPYYHWVNGYLFNEKWAKLTPYLKKGVNCFVCGQLKLNPYINREGMAALEIGIFIDRIELLSSFAPFEERKVPMEPSSKPFPQEYEESPSIHHLYPMEERKEVMPTEVYYCDSGNEDSQKKDKEDSAEKTPEEYLFDDVPF